MHCFHRRIASTKISFEGPSFIGNLVMCRPIEIFAQFYSKITVVVHNSQGMISHEVLGDERVVFVSDLDPSLAFVILG